jgi:cbb3-type cytochrome oxidase subunit 3
LPKFRDLGRIRHLATASLEPTALGGNILRPEQFSNSNFAKFMTSLAKKISILSAVFCFVLLPFFSLPVLAQTGNYGLDETRNTGNLNTALINKSPQQVVGTVVGAILSLLGVIFFLLIFYGGMRWMLAEGNEQEVEKAKEILVAASIGLVIVLAAYAITAYIGAQLTAS